MSLFMSLFNPIRNSKRSMELQLKLQIAQHLQQLLNTRRAYLPRAQAIGLGQYGLPDLTQYNPHAEEDKAALCEAVQTVIEQFEPRICAVSVALLESDQELQPFMLPLKISAFLRTLSREPIEFISLLNQATQQLKIEACL